MKKLAEKIQEQMFLNSGFHFVNHMQYKYTS